MVRNRPVAERTAVLFLCTGNSCRSQMAEGLARHLCGEHLEAASAGTAPQPLNRYAVQVMAEIGIDISSHRPKSIAELTGRSFDCVITVCSSAHDTCPTWPGQGRVMHHPFDDPPHLAATARAEEERLAVYRRVRDEIRAYVLTLPERIAS